MATDWKKIAQDKADSVNNLIPKEWRLEKIPTKEEQRDVTGKYMQQFLSEQEIKITEADAPEIVGYTTTGKWKSVDVAKAFCHRAAVAHQLVNCLHEIFFDRAFQRAKELDRHLQETGKTVGPLHGVPISLKDQFHVSGVETTMGYVGWIGTQGGKRCVDRGQSLLVRELLSLGAVLYCKVCRSD